MMQQLSLLSYLISLKISKKGTKTLNFLVFDLTNTYIVIVTEKPGKHPLTEIFQYPNTYASCSIIFLQQLNQMFGKLNKIAFKYAPHIKHLQTTAASIPSGLRVTYPHLNNKTHDIQNPLQTFISSLAACQTQTLKQVAKQKGFKLGSITWNLIESNYDLGHWMSGGGKNNKISDVYLDAEIETNLDQAEFDKVKAITENLCPIFQMVMSSGVKVNSNWKLKKID